MSSMIPTNQLISRLLDLSKSCSTNHSDWNALLALVNSQATQPPTEELMSACAIIIATQGLHVCVWPGQSTLSAIAVALLQAKNRVGLVLDGIFDIHANLDSPKSQLLCVQLATLGDWHAQYAVNAFVEGLDPSTASPYKHDTTKLQLSSLPQGFFSASVRSFILFNFGLFAQRSGVKLETCFALWEASDTAEGMFAIAHFSGIDKLKKLALSGNILAKIVTSTKLKELRGITTKQPSASAHERREAFLEMSKMHDNDGNVDESISCLLEAAKLGSESAVRLFVNMTAGRPRRQFCEHQLLEIIKTAQIANTTGAEAAFQLVSLRRRRIASATEFIPLVDSFTHGRELVSMKIWTEEEYEDATNAQLKAMAALGDFHTTLFCKNSDN